jgi:hypothetical protein
MAYGLDNHLGLFNGLIQPNINYIFQFFSVVYIPALIIFHCVSFGYLRMQLIN